MKARIILAAMAVTGLAAVLAIQAQEVPGRTATVDIAKMKDDLRLREQILARQFSEFEDSLLKLKDRLKRSGKSEDKLRAEILEKVLEQSKDASISVQFEQMVEMLKNSKLAGIGDLKILDERSHKLADDLRDILAKMREDPKHSRLRDERMSLERLLKEIEKIIHDQKVVQGQTDRNKTDPKELKSNQGQVTKATDKVGKEMAKSNKNDKGGEAKNTKGDAKDGGKEAKKGESKDAGKGPETKKGESKEAGAKSDSKEGDKKGQAKAGEKSDSNQKKSEAKEGAKGGEKSKSDLKKGEPKEPGSAKPSKNAQAKSGDAKPGDAKSGQKDSKQGEAKAGQKSDGKGEAKKGEAKSGEKGDPQKAGEKGEPQAQQAKDNIANGRKQVQDAEYKMKQAEEKIAKKNNKDASEDQGKAIQDLEKAKKKLEDLLRQIREEELERLLAALQARCEKMLAMQIQVQTGTYGVFRSVDAATDKKPSRQNQQDSLKLSDNEKDIVTEANKAIEMLEAEGSAVAFPEVFQQVRQDMMHVQRRLEVTDVAVVTQAIEKDIVDTLKEMIEALKKARQDMEKTPPPPGASPPPPSGPRDQKLLDQIAELKMIRSMQIRVNSRTETYGRMYVPKEGEQTADPTIRRELSNLSERQERIFDVANRIAKGDNK